MAGLEEGELRIVMRVVGEELAAGMTRMQSIVNSATSQVRTQFKETETAVTSSMAGIRQRIESGLGASGLTGAIASLRTLGTVAAEAFALFGVERFLANAINATQEWAFEVEHLNKTLGVSTEEASVYAVALKETGVGTEVIDRAAKGIIRTLNTNAGAFTHIGVTVRDVHGALLPLPEALRNVLDGVDQYRAGTDRLAAAQSVFGGRVQPETLEALRRWIEAIPHAREVTAAFGLELSEEGVASARAYQRATADLELVMLGFKERVATAALPVLEAFIAKVIALAKDGTLKAWGDDAATALKGLGAILEPELKVLHDIAVAIGLIGDAVKTLRAINVTELPVIATYWHVFTQALIDSVPWLREVLTIQQALAALHPPPLPETRGGAGRDFSEIEEREPPSDRDASGARIEPGDKRYSGTNKQALAAEKAEYDSLQKRQEADLKFFEHNEAAKYAVVQAYSAAIAKLHNLSGAQWQTQQTKETEAKNRAADQQRAIDDLETEHGVKNALRVLDEDAKVVETRRKLGLITVDQAVAAETDLENRRTVIIAAGLQARLDLLKEDPNSDPVAKRRLDLELEDEEVAHQQRLTELVRKADEERLAAEKENAKVLGEVFGSLGQAFNTALESAVDGTRSRAEVMRSIWQGLLKDVIKIVEQIAATWAKQQAVGLLTGEKTNATGGALSDQFSGALGGAVKKGAGTLFGGLFGGGSKEGTQTAATYAQKAAAALTGEAKLTAIAQAGETARGRVQQQGLAHQLVTWIGHQVKMVATEAVNLAKSLAHWIATHATKLAITVATEAQILAVKAASGAAGLVQEAAQIIKSIVNNAYGAASGAANAVASIPYAGPILAVANFGAILSFVLKAVGSIVSAEAGLEEVPSGGALVQTHAGESILRRPIAENVRRLFGGQAGLGEALDAMGSVGGGSGASGVSPSFVARPATYLHRDAIARGESAQRTAAARAELAAGTATGRAVPEVHVHLATLGLPTEREVIGRHADYIADAVAKRWRAGGGPQGGGGRHP